VVDPRGEYEDVGAVGVSGEDIGDDLLEPGLIGMLKGPGADARSPTEHRPTPTPIA
jgi:hypothetical protein